MRQVTFWRACFVIAAVWTGCLTGIMAQPAETPAQPLSIWKGVYSEAQAFRGEKVADTVCLGCHGAGLEGGDSGPKLVGESFLAAWNNKSVGELFDFIVATMPENAPGTLKAEDAAAAIAYMLKANSVPSGRQNLPSEREALQQISILSAKP